LVLLAIERKQMEVTYSDRVNSLTTYPFAILERKVRDLRKQGVHVIDLGVGSPTAETPAVVREAIKKSVDARKNEGYPTYEGMPEFRQACGRWLLRRYGVELDPEQQITSCMGTKEALFHFPEAFVNPGETVIVPSPGYSPYVRGTAFAEGNVHFMPLLPERGFLPDLSTIPKDVADRARLMWINYPNNPTAATAPREFYEETVEFGRRHGIIVCSDEAYSDIYFDEKPVSILEVSVEGVIATFSLSKRSAMANYRVGFVAGDADVIAGFRKIKTNVDSGMPTFIQDAAIAAYGDEAHVEAMREEYRVKRDVLVEALVAAGLPRCSPRATFYIWQKIPEGCTSVEFAQRLLSPNIGVVVMPGEWLGDKMKGGSNTGEGYVRLALVAPEQEVREAAGRISSLRL
jgi:LL-diaminopimelate aminotransferase